MFRNLTKSERSWVLYDWANSAYSIVITTAIFPIFYESITPEAIYVTTWGYANSLASLLVAVMAPILGTLADYWGRKKKLFLLFFLIGVLTTMSLVMVSDGQWMLALVLYIGSVVGFSGANIFYDAFLVDVTDEKRMDWVSASGFGWGYIGSTIPFMASMILIMNAGALGLPATTAVQISFLMTGLWWFFFTIPFLRNVKQNYGIEPSKTPVSDSFKRIGKTLFSAMLQEKRARHFF